MSTRRGKNKASPSSEEEGQALGATMYLPKDDILSRRSNNNLAAALGTGDRLRPPSIVSVRKLLARLAGEKRIYARYWKHGRILTIFEFSLTADELAILNDLHADWQPAFDSIWVSSGSG